MRLLCCLFMCAYFIGPASYAENKERDCGELLADPYLWLEDIEGERALNWVRAQNARSLDYLESHPLYKEILEEARAIAFAKDRVPFSEFSEGYFWNFWQDEKNSHGLIRRATYDEYLKSKPNWDVLLNLDELSKQENENWVYKGSLQLGRGSQRHLLKLSRGGKDATVIREYDYATRRFVEHGFNVPVGKTHLAPIDENTVVIGTNFGPGSLTDAGYPRMLKIWRRGEPLSSAKKIFEIMPNEVGAFFSVIEHAGQRTFLITRNIGNYERRYYLWGPNMRVQPFPAPRKCDLYDIRDGQVYLLLKEDVGAFLAGSLVKMPLQAQSVAEAKLVFKPEANQSIVDVAVGRGRVFINLIEDVSSKVVELKPMEIGYSARTLNLPRNGNISFNYRDEDDATHFSSAYFTNHLTPYSQYRLDENAEDLNLEVLKAAQPRFDSAQFESVQRFAFSKDGTKVPYYLIRKKGLALDGSNPTVLYGYGGFEISLTPSYSANIGKLWLERGGVYVIANLRGGGEYGPDWHNSVLKENRQKVYDDFAAVAEDLIAQGITSPRHLGIWGGSNGGLLTAAVMLQRAELFNAVLSQVPLLDMKRYSKLLAGASWMNEYGDPETEDWDFISKYSPYQNVRADRIYPTPLFTTSTKDDRVHPGHARKMVARMREQGHQVLGRVLKVD